MGYANKSAWKARKHCGGKIYSSPYREWSAMCSENRPSPPGMRRAAKTPPERLNRSMMEGLAAVPTRGAGLDAQS